MSNHVESFFEQQDVQTQLMLSDLTGDQLTEIAVEALYRAFELLREEAGAETLH